MTMSMGYAKVAAVVELAASHIGCKEFMMTVASRLYFFNFCRLVSFFMITSSLVGKETAMNHWKMPSSMVFISSEFTASALMVLSVLLRMMAFRGRFCQKWCNIFDVVGLVSVAMYFNEKGVLRELEEVVADSALALRNAVQYIRLALFLSMIGYFLEIQF